MSVASIIFAAFFVAAIAFFSWNVRKIIRNIRLGRPIDRSDNRSERLKTMARVALGQSKMTRRPIAGLLHIMVYVGFVIINIEMLEIILDGISGEHRMFAGMGGFYVFLINAFEWLALGVLVACLIFLIRRNVLHLRRFHLKEMTLWPRSDANIILIVECVLMTAFLFMNAADQKLMGMDLAGMGDQFHHYATVGISSGDFQVSALLSGILPDDPEQLMFIERTGWWVHIVGVLLFLNYLPYSKHFHIILAFPNTYFSNLKAKGEFSNMESVKKEVELMMDPNADPFAAPPEGEEPAEPQRFGAKDVRDLSWKNLMDAYSCTECGRCTSSCPANITGKQLSPRKIMMDTRDRLEEVGRNIDKHGADHEDGKSLLGDYITPEELWACTTCNACVQECPVNIDPLNIILEMRRYLVMEQSQPPSEWATMFTNVENNGAPWQFAASDRLNWKDEN